MKLFQPFAKLRPTSATILAGGQFIVSLLLWQWSTDGLIPGPGQVAEATGSLLGSRMLFDHLLISMVLTIKALALSLLFTLAIAYLSVIPFFAALAQFLVKCRYLTLTGLIFVFTLLTRDGHDLKLSLLVFGMVPFFVTSFLGAILRTDAQQIELCRTLGYTNWEILYEVLIIGKAEQALEILRQNFAIAWLMITLVEGLNMSEGGIGTLLIKYNKYNNLTYVLALQCIIFLTGVGFDLALGALRRWLFPHTRKINKQ